MDNTVSVKITGEDDTGGAFAKATAEAKAFSKVMNDAGRQEVRSNIASSDAIGAHMRATRLLTDAEKALADGERVLADHTDKASSSQGIFSRILSGPVQGALDAAFSGFTNLGGSMGNAQAGGFNLQGVLLALIPVIAGVVVALTPFIAALGAITIGFGVFAAVAIPEISKVWKAVSAGGKAWAALSPQQKAAGRELKDLQGEFHKLSKALQPEILRGFDEALKVMKDLMPAIKPLAEAAGKAIDGLLKHIDDWLRSGSGQKFIKWFQTDGVKALSNFGKVAWDTMKVIGNVFHFMYDTGERFDQNWRVLWHDAARAFDSFVTGFQQMGHLIVADTSSVWHSVSTIVANFARGFQQLGHEILTVVDGLVRGFQQMGSLIAGVWNSLVGTISGAVSTIEGLISGLNSALGGIPGKILGALGFAAGGVVGAASGGARSGLTLVGELGPELVRLPPGSQVFNNAQTQQMLGGGGGAQQIILQVDPGGASAFEQFMTTAIRQWVRVKGGGNVQTAFGRP